MNKKSLSANIDWEKLLAPISEDRPAGEFLIHKGVYDEIKEARRQDNAALDQGIWPVSYTHLTLPTIYSV